MPPSAGVVLGLRQRGARISVRRAAQLTWFDRDGKTMEVVGQPADDTDLALSPDGKFAAVSHRQENNRDIWLLDLTRRVPSRFTFDPAIEEYLVWSPDGSQLVFTSVSNGRADLFRKAANNAGSEEVLLASSLQKRAFDWSADGKSLLYTVLDPKTKFDLLVL
ncbi:MAG TPA: hypothetical protein VGH38_36755, partial [Bryobacteraceae bacterium]